MVETSQNEESKETIEMSEEGENRNVFLESIKEVASSVSPAIDIADKKENTVPEIVIDANQLVDEPQHPVLDNYENGSCGLLHSMYSNLVFQWLDIGLEIWKSEEKIDIDSPSVFRHTVDLVATNSLTLVLKEIENQISTIIPDLNSRIFQLDPENKRGYSPFGGNRREFSEEFILVSRNLEHWKIGVKDDFVDPNIIKTRTVKVSQHFHPLILLPSVADPDVPNSVSPPTLGKRALMVSQSLPPH